VTDQRADAPRDAVPETVRYADGKIKHSGYRLDGEMHGAWTWFRTDGSMMRAGAFDRGKQVGVWRTFDRSGAVVKETDFSRGRTSVGRQR